jgi:hypothetical protein
LPASSNGSSLQKSFSDKIPCVGYTTKGFFLFEAGAAASLLSNGFRLSAVATAGSGAMCNWKRAVGYLPPSGLGWAFLALVIIQKNAGRLP